MSCSTSSSASLVRVGKSADAWVVEDKSPGAASAEACCLETEEDVDMPRKGREYALRKVENRGSDDSVGSLES